jgi:hypothetical protein
MYSHVLFSDIATSIGVDAPAIAEDDGINLPAKISSGVIGGAAPATTPATGR